MRTTMMVMERKMVRVKVSQPAAKIPLLGIFII